MPKSVTRLGIGLLLLAVGIGGFCIWKKLNPPLEPFDPTHIRELQVISYCELRNKPTEYDGKVVRIDTNLYWFQHGYFLADPACAAATDPKYLDSERTAVTVETGRRDEIFDFLRQNHSSERPFQPIRITAVGRFTYRTRENYSDAIQDRTPYRFEVYSIENLQTLKEATE